jgi:hypothetical protein
MLSSFELVLIDELGFVPLSKTGAELLFARIIAARIGDRNVREAPRQPAPVAEVD